jgi:hypothetical protein
MSAVQPFGIDVVTNAANAILNQQELIISFDSCLIQVGNGVPKVYLQYLQAYGTVLK